MQSKEEVASWPRLFSDVTHGNFMSTLFGIFDFHFSVDKKVITSKLSIINKKMGNEDIKTFENKILYQVEVCICFVCFVKSFKIYFFFV